MSIIPRVHFHLSLGFLCTLGLNLVYELVAIRTSSTFPPLVTLLIENPIQNAASTRIATSRTVRHRLTIHLRRVYVRQLPYPFHDGPGIMNLSSGVNDLLRHQINALVPQRSQAGRVRNVRINLALHLPKLSLGVHLLS